MKEFQVKSTGRICFFGDNADLIEKPAIAAAISAYLTIDFKERPDTTIVLQGVDIDYEETLDVNRAITPEGPLRYIKAVINRMSGYIDTGFEIAVQSEIPIGAGMSSSTALTIAAIRAIAQWKNLTLSPEEIADLSFVTENRDLKTGCGRMDQYAISFGGITYITTDENAGAERIAHMYLPVIVADSCESHNTEDLQVWLRDRIKKKDAVLMNSLSRVVEIVEEGKRAFQSGNLKDIGSLMTRQQREENLMGTATEKLNAMCTVALKSGALGAKQMGAGGGGCIIALCRPGTIDPVKQALAAEGCPVWKYNIV